MVTVSQRIWRISIQVQSHRQHYRILLGKSTAARVVITEKIIVQSGFSANVLPGIVQQLMVKDGLPCKAVKAFLLALILTVAAVLAALLFL